MKTTQKKRLTSSRSLALEVLRRVEAEGAYASLTLNHALRKATELSSADRRLTAELVYGTLRWRKRLDHVLTTGCHRSLEKIEPILLRILRMSLYQLLFLDRIPHWAAVDQATELASVIKGKKAAGFVNAVLRRIAGRLEKIVWPNPGQNVAKALAVIHSYPTWMVERWLKRFGRKRAESLMDALNRPALQWIRINSLRSNLPELQSRLAASGHQIREHETLPGALLLDRFEDLSQLGAHQSGCFHVQDAAAQAVCHLLAPLPDQRILDACGAPGGKAATLAQLMGDKGDILSVDIHPARVDLIGKLTERLGLRSVRAVCRDLTQPIPADWGQFDAILLDAPCSSLGTLRRHPERKWTLSESEPKRLAGLQRRLLDSVSRVLRPNGVLVYSVCTFTEEENFGLVRAWLADHPEFMLTDPRKRERQPWHRLLDERGALSTWPDHNGMDAFYAVRLRKKERREEMT